MTCYAARQVRASAVDDGLDEDDATQAVMLKAFTKIDASLIKLIAHACKAERTARALDLATQLQLPKSLQGALRLANHYKLGALAERISKLMQARFDDVEDDVEEAPPPPAPAQRVAPPASRVSAPPPAAKPPTADDDADDDADDEENDGGGAGGAPPANPFAKGLAKPADTLKGPKRALPVTSLAGGKKLKK
jgi:hypothetical protein